MNNTILAIDLGKYKSVVGLYDKISSHTQILPLSLEPDLVTLFGAATFSPLSFWQRGWG